MAKKIKLSKGKFAIVDDADFEWLNQWKWSYTGHMRGEQFGYAVRRVYPNGRYEKGVTILMHRLIMCPSNEQQVDHIDNDRLNCRRLNMRLCSRRENLCNKIRAKNNKTGFKGVCWHKINKVWTAYITAAGVRMHLGCFKDKASAARAYDRAAKEFHGRFAHLNFKE